MKLDLTPSGRCAFLVFLLAALPAFTGCKAKPAPAAGFAEASLMSTDPTLPFQKSWEKPNLDRTRYTAMYVAPVNTSYMLGMTDWQKGERRKEIEADVAKLGAFTQDAIEKAFRDDKGKRFRVVEQRPTSGDAIILEMALIEVVPSKVTLNALGFAPFFVGTAVSVTRGAANDVASTAFEARLRDAATGEVIAQYADREQQQWAPISVRGLTWYSHAEATISQWSQQFVQVAGRKPGQKVKDIDPFTLMPW